MIKKFICDVGAIEASSSKKFIGPGGKEGILVNSGGTLKAFVNSCPHQGGTTVLEYNPEGVGRLRCLSHGALFDPMTGDALSAPAPMGSRLRELSLIIEDNKIYYQ